MGLSCNCLKRSRAEVGIEASTSELQGSGGLFYLKNYWIESSPLLSPHLFRCQPRLLEPERSLLIFLLLFLAINLAYITLISTNFLREFQVFVKLESNLKPREKPILFSLPSPSLYSKFINRRVYSTHISNS